MPEVTEWRRWLHSHPELLFELPETEKFILERLKESGVSNVHRGLAQTGIVALIEGLEKGPTIALRADMDALPIHELSEVDHRSAKDGKMHACGHDGHTAMLLGAAKVLRETRRFAGRVALVFQPAEEGGVGAEAMIKDGLFDKFDIEEIYGMHNMPSLPVGHFAMCFGPSHAAVDTFEIAVTGNGGHAARPHHGNDPIAAFNSLYTAFQTIITRSTDPIRNGLISVTAIQSGEAFNVIPETALIRGTVRALHDETQSIIETRMHEVCAGIAASHNVEIALDYHRKCPVSINHDVQAQLACDVAISIVGEDAVDTHSPPRLGGEDFSFMLSERPGAVINLGNGDTPGLHNPRFDFADEAIQFGMAYWVSLIETRLPLQAN